MATSVDPSKVAELERKVDRAEFSIKTALGFVGLFGLAGVVGIIWVITGLTTATNEIKHLAQQSEKTENRLGALEVRIMDRFDSLQKQISERPAATKGGP